MTFLNAKLPCIAEIGLHCSYHIRHTYVMFSYTVKFYLQIFIFKFLYINSSNNVAQWFSSLVMSCMALILVQCWCQRLYGHCTIFRLLKEEFVWNLYYFFFQYLILSLVELSVPWAFCEGLIYRFNVFNAHMVI